MDPAIEHSDRELHHGVVAGPAVLGLIAGYAFSVPYEDLKLKAK
jgi:hypothetical protein